MNLRIIQRGAQTAVLVTLLALLAACGPSNTAQTPSAPASPTASTTPSNTSAGAPSNAPSNAPTTVPTSAPSAATTSAPAATPTTAASSAPSSAPSDTSGATPVAGGSQPSYLDDRSTGAALIESLYNAINLKQYARAYSYWETGQNVPPFDQFAQGYTNVGRVQVTLGTVSVSAGAGQRYFTVPVALQSTSNDGSTQTFAGCYTLHLASPDAQAAPPFRPLGIEAATIAAVDNSANLADLAANACAQQNAASGAQPAPSPVADPADISASRYLDDRSDPIQAVRSLYNAINSRQYARAYSYWQTGQNVPPFDQFGQGYAATQAVQLQTGNVQQDAGAGQLNARVPVAITATQNDGTTQTFAGCYTLHLANPNIQAAPPFDTWGITGAMIQPVDNGADTAELLAQACQ